MVCDNLKGIGLEVWEKMVKNGNKIAQIDGLTGKKDTYASLLQRCTRTAIVMRTKGVTNEDIVMTCSFNYLDTCVPLLATQFLGAITTAIDPTLSHKDVVHLLKQVTPKLIFVMSDSVALVEEALREIGLTIEIVVFGQTLQHTPFSSFLKTTDGEESFRPEEVRDINKTGLILFSSGTTGLSKGICLKNLNFLECVKQNILPSRYAFDINLVATSFYWITANIFLLVSIFTGTTRLVLPTFDAANVWKVIDNHRPTMIFAPPSQIMELAMKKINQEVDRSSIKQILVSGVTIFQKHVDTITSAFPKASLIQIYGQTEIGMTSMFRLCDPEEIGLVQKYPLSNGRIFPMFTYKVVDLETEEEVEPGTPGELRIKCDTLIFNGYFNLDSTGVFDNNGWLRTGDIVRFNSEGCLYIIDREKDLLKFQSWHVPPAAIEQVLITHPEVESCLVIGIPHEIDGDHPMAVVVLKKSDKQTTPEELREFVDRQVDDRKRLRGGVRIVSKIPTTGTGKVKKNAIRNLILSGDL